MFHSARYWKCNGKKHRAVRGLYFLIITALILAFAYTSLLVNAQVVPEITPEEFARLVTTFSEYGGHFPSDNWVSNELTYLNVLEPIRRHNVNGGVYIGVGPNQNFVYIAAIKPDIAFIIDVRHQNRMQHLIYKVLFELSETRAEFFSLLFSKPLDPSSDLSETGNIDTLVQYFSHAPSDRELLNNTRERIENILTTKYGFDLSERDTHVLWNVLENFYIYNIDITYYGPRRAWYPTFAQLLRMKTPDGEQQNPFNSTKEYQYLRMMHLQNRIIPVTGDFAGTGAFQKISEYLNEYNQTVTACYTSNVEQYLLRNSLNWYGWSNNIKHLPITDRSVFIRWTHDGRGYDQHTRLQWITSFIKNNEEGKYHTFYDLGRLDYIK